MTGAAGHHDVEQRTHDARGVAKGLVATELDGTRAIELGMPTEVGHGRLEGEAGTGGDLLEDHAKGLVAQQVGVVAVNLDGLLHRKAEVLDGKDLFLGEVVGVDEVLGHCHGALPLFAT